MSKKKKKRRKIQKKQEFKGVHFLAPEFVYYQKGIFWYILLIIIGLGLIGASIWLKYWLLGVIIFLALIVFLQYSKKRPRSKDCHITKDGIKIDDKFFPIGTFKSFSVRYDEPSSHLFLETVKRFYPSFWLNVKNKDLERVGISLSQILPEKPTEGNMLARINRWIKF